MKLLRILAIERLLRGLIICVIGVQGLRLSTDHLRSLSQWNQALEFVTKINANFANAILHSSLYERLFKLQQSNSLNWLALFFMIFCYGILLSIEAVGLWFDVLWAEKLTVISTSAFIPIELWELFMGVTALKSAALVVNIFLVTWLYRNRWRKAQ